MTSIQHPQSVNTVFLDQPPSCLEFCPEAPDHFIVGTYLLSENKTEDGEVEQSKTGSLQLWKLDPVSKTLSQIQRITVPYAVFDLHFHPRHKNLFAIASSVGSVALFQVSTNSTGDTSASPNITQLWTKQVHEDPSIPALFLAWAPQNWFPKPADGFAVTFSDSRTAVFGTEGDIRQEESIAEWGTYEAKQMIEVWFVALSTSTGNPDPETQNPSAIPFMFTGNDFGSLHTRRFDKTTELDDPDEHISPMLLEHDDRARHHTAGVTAILPLDVPLVDDAPVLLTGCYDESLRVYHATRRGEVLAEQGLDGGVWRLQLLNTTRIPGSDDSNVSGYRFLVLASCMHAGTRLVRVTCKHEDGAPNWGIEVLAKFTEHESMNYASGVWEGGQETTRSSEVLCVSSSFYDRRLCVWTVDL
ncbi:unnamed protein product [Penicillium nalgiovense]|uniref:Diphthine methyltransferase n=1 Tax=Penicillium nalgiovense TaxID=60175 RepID=A0A1V6YU99_PENNA|nr:hypothetical protein PENNAL_c0011G05677 [Penicillium nalgiovense]CAG7961298.1 unnamed protein product [Penicillium nalgiovense]CAG7988062.1 unnamed protein product [Penicillium nalgiovense]CAG8014174.1 unnamed protein product [Penicillium nalgiovense]CAG8035171.1 unnamed protein product [Penicillium nalgiovense]